MKLTKLGHSCVLVEEQDKVALFDPGTWANKELILRVTHVDEIVYTHEHPDHFSPELLQMLVARFPEVAVVCNAEIQSKITDAGISVKMSEESESARKFTAPHEQLPIPGSQPPAENGYHFIDIFSHPGDSQHFSETKKVLAMPFIGPWGKTGDSIELVLKLKPAYVLPIHDWHYTEEAKQWLQGVLEAVLKPAGITVLKNENGLEQTI